MGTVGKRVRVLLADDHKIVLEGLRRLLDRDFDLVGIVADGRALLEAARKLKPDVIVTDISMPLMDGIEAAGKLREEGSSARVVFLTMHGDGDHVQRAYAAGASALVLKYAAFTELADAIRGAMASRRQPGPELQHTPNGHCTRREGDLNTALTPRQREVLRLLAQGRRSKEIARALHISPRTVEFHKYCAMKRLGIKSMAELTQYAIKQGIVTI
jgi:DNA-binding NarL/FixJ family response regulator